MVQETVSPAAIADEEQGCQENQGTNCARLPFQKEAEQVEAHEHGVAEPQGGVEGLGDEEDGQQPLEAIHDLCWTGPLPRPPGTAAGTDLMGASGRGRLPSAFFNPRSPGAELLWSLAVRPGSPRQQGSRESCHGAAATADAFAAAACLHLNSPPTPQEAATLLLSSG